MHCNILHSRITYRTNYFLRYCESDNSECRIYLSLLFRPISFDELTRSSSYRIRVVRFQEALLGGKKIKMNRVRTLYRTVVLQTQPRVSANAVCVDALLSSRIIITYCIITARAHTRRGREPARRVYFRFRVSPISRINAARLNRGN